MLRPVALALGLLVLPLAVPAWFPSAAAESEEGDAEVRIARLKMEVDVLSANLSQMYGGILPPPVEMTASGIVPLEAYVGPSAFSLTCREGIAATATQHLAGVPWVCVYPTAP